MDFKEMHKASKDKTNVIGLVHKQIEYKRDGKKEKKGMRIENS